jgi:signal transduction histidine kinase
LDEPKVHTQSQTGKSASTQYEARAPAGQLALEMVHEIRNPLEALNALLYLGVENAHRPDEVLRYLRLAQEQASILNEIVSSTLGYARSPRAALPTSLVSLVEAALRINQRTLTAKNIRVVKDLPATLVAVVRAGEILQVVSNLIENAVDALLVGGTLCLRVRSRKDSVHILVADNGHGIPSAQLSDIFTPYFTTKGERGTGLGLAVSKAIIERHGGTIRVRSNTQSGTAFRVSLPTQVAAVLA